MENAVIAANNKDKLVPSTLMAWPSGREIVRMAKENAESRRSSMTSGAKLEQLTEQCKASYESGKFTSGEKRITIVATWVDSMNETIKDTKPDQQLVKAHKEKVQETISLVTKVMIESWTDIVLKGIMENKIDCESLAIKEVISVLVQLTAGKGISNIEWNADFVLNGPLLDMMIDVSRLHALFNSKEAAKVEEVGATVCPFVWGGGWGVLFLSLDVVSTLFFWRSTRWLFFLTTFGQIRKHAEQLTSRICICFLGS